MFTSQRTRLNLDYTGDKITTKLVLQDVRNWGNQKQLVGNEDYVISIHEAWAEAADQTADLLPILSIWSCGALPDISRS